MKEYIKARTTIYRLILAGIPLFLSFLSLPAHSTDLKEISVITDSRSQYQFQSIIKRLKKELAGHPKLSIKLPEEYLPEESVNNCHISIGPKSFEKLQETNTSCRLALLISKNRYDSTSQAFKDKTSAIFINQPLKRITSVLKKVFKSAEYAALVISPDWSESINLNQSGTDLYIKRLKEGGSVINAFRSASKNADFIIAVPDPKVYNRSNIKNILLTTYKYRVPLIGYSEALSRAGALVSIYTPAEYLGLQSAQWVKSGYKYYANSPKYFHVKLNTKVAKTLGTKLKNKELFEKEIWEDSHE